MSGLIDSMEKEQKINYWRELLLTFTVRESLFSSKKIERFIIFGVLMGMTILYMLRNIESLSALGFIEICVMWLTYAGYNTIMNHRDKGLEKENPKDN